MTQVIIYNQDNGIPAVVIPTEEALKDHTILEIAVKDVPAGKPFAIVDASELPTEPQETWIIDDADLTDGVGNEFNEFEPKPEGEVIEGDDNATD